jgi:hypothetical protein
MGWLLAYAVASDESQFIFDYAVFVLQLLVSSPLRRQKIKPEAKLTGLSIPLKPSDVHVEPLT